MKLLQEFHAFAIKGNVIDLAVGVIIGGAFGKIISSLVSDVIMPLIGILLLGVDFSGLAFTFGESTIAYGLFLQSVLDFLIMAFCIFLMVRQINRMKRKPAPVEPGPPPADIQLLTEIRDLLRKKK